MISIENGLISFEIFTLLSQTCSKSCLRTLIFPFLLLVLVEQDPEMARDPCLKPFHLLIRSSSTEMLQPYHRDLLSIFHLARDYLSQAQFLTFVFLYLFTQPNKIKSEHFCLEISSDKTLSLNFVLRKWDRR